MRKYILLIILFSVTIASMSCFAQTTDNPVENFEAMWNLYDSNYALFGPKNIDWDMIYELYRPKVNAGTTNEELFLILSNMLEHLNDNHVNLRSTNPRKRFNAGILNRMRMDDFSLDLIKRSYLNNEYDQKLNNFTYGWLTDEIGYFHFRGFRNPEASGRAIDEIIEYFSDAKGMVIDVRNNRGGDDWAGKAIADRFADRQRLYMKTYERSGPEHDDFNPPKYFYVEPNGKKQFTKPVILLTHRFSISAAENFALAMRVLPHVTVVGDFTSGVFADVYGDRLPNGWSVSISYKKFVDCNDFCWEGIGVPMDMRIVNSKEDIDNGTDRILDFAVGLINSGGINHQNEDDSLKDIRESLAQTLDKNIEERGIEYGLREFNRKRSGDPAYWYIDRREMESLARELDRSGNPEHAIEVVKLNIQAHPEDYRTYFHLAALYKDQGNTDLAKENYRKTLDLNRRSYPWEKEAFNTAKNFVDR